MVMDVRGECSVRGGRTGVEEQLGSLSKVCLLGWRRVDWTLD